MKDNLIMTKTELNRKGIFDRVKEGLMSKREGSTRLSITCRHFRRMYNRYLLEGDEGIIHKGRGCASNHRKDSETRAKIIGLYRAKYIGFGPTLASEKLEEDDGHIVNKETLRLWLKEAGL